MVHQPGDLSLDDIYLLECDVCKPHGKGGLDFFHFVELDHRHNQAWSPFDSPLGSLGTTCGRDSSIPRIAVGLYYDARLEFCTFPSHLVVLHQGQWATENVGSVLYELPADTVTCVQCRVCLHQWSGFRTRSTASSCGPRGRRLHAHLVHALLFLHTGSPGHSSLPNFFSADSHLRLVTLTGGWGVHRRVQFLEVLSATCRDGVRAGYRYGVATRYTNDDKGRCQ